MSLNHEQSPGDDPTSSKATKRNSGLFSFFKWFKTLSRESLTEVISSSSSTDSLTSIQSNATVASFSFVQPNQYVKQTEKIILEDREDTDTLKARLKHRDEVRESDRNVTLRKKYNLFLFRDTFLRPSKKDEDNTKSLPLMATTQMDMDQNVSGHRRTNSDSSKIKKAGSYLHVKGKRRAPQPPTVNKVDSASLRRAKKRPAPAKPHVIENDSPQPENSYETINFTTEDVLVNDSLKLDHGILKQTKNIESADGLKPSSARTSYVEPLGSSPKPWYKRTSSKEPHHKELERTPSERLPEVQYSRNSTSAESQVTQERQEQNKRKSGMSFLTNISELDREATELFKLQKNGSATSITNRSVVVAEMPEFMRPKTDTKITPDNTTTKKKGARDLIAKFNAITSATKVTVNLFGHNQKRKEYFGRSVSHEDRRHQETLLDAHKRRIESIDKRINVQPIGLMKSESASAVKKPETPKSERKTWSCPKCYLDNEYWRIICHVCSAIKPYFDEVTPLSKEQKFIPKSPLIKPKNSPERFLERSRTQIGFSALANFNNNVIPKEITLEDEKIKEDKEKLKKMLIEMKNSLPKRKLNGLAAKPNQNRASIIVEKEEVLEIKDKSLNDKEVQKIGDANASAKIDGPQEVRETKIADPHKLEVKKAEQPPKIYPKLDSLIVDPPKVQKLDSAKTQEEMVCEILIGTKETIYENIKVKKTEIPKPVKVSSSAQTSSIVNKTPTNLTSLQTAAVKAVIKKKNSFEPMKPSEFNDIYSEKNGQTSAARIYANLARNDELSLFFNVPKNLCDFKNNLKLNHDGKTDTIEINRLLRRLEISIAKGELNEAAIFAKELAQLKVNCSVVRQKLSDEEPTLKKNCLSIDMYVEDQISHRGPFTLQVSETQTVLNLKKQVEKEFQIPVNVQRWILGKELTTNDEATLKECHVTSNGCPVFLYLVAPTEQKASTSSKTTAISVEKNLILDSKSSDIVPPKIINITPAKNVEKEPENPNLATALVTTTIVNYCPPKIINLLPKNSQIPFNSDAKNSPPEIVTKEKISTNEKITPVVENATNGDFKIKQESLKILKEVEKKHEEKIIGVNILKPEEVPKKATLEDEFDDFSKTLRPQNKTEWECHLCTLLNPLSSNICAVCATVRQKNKIKSLKRKKAPKVPIDEYLQLVNLDNADLVSNSDQFECLVCFLDILPKEGVTLRECLHQFCKECLKHTIQFSEDAEVKCPYRDEQYSCNTALQDREIKALVTTEVYDQFLAKSVAQAENKMDKTFHCKTPDCKGWCIFEDNVNEFRCPVCRRANCLTCQAIHIGLNCKEYQEKMNDESDIDESARQTKKMLQEMVDKGEALNCPTCQVILIKKWGCDWLRCSMCKTEICWVTRGPRWGPAGKGDISGGCQCGLKGVKCHPKCNYCH